MMRSLSLRRMPLGGIIFLLCFAGSALSADADLLDSERAKAVEQYRRRPESDRSKLIYLMERFRDTDVQVVYDGYNYGARESAVHARQYIARHYKKGRAGDWVREHAYRSNPGGQIIYLKFPDGRIQTLRDVLLEELTMLETLMAQTSGQGRSSFRDARGL